MSIAPWGQAVFSAAELFAVGTALAVLLHFLRKPDLVKAKFFLNFGAFRAFFVAILALGSIAISTSAFMALSGAYGSEMLESWGGFAVLEAPTVGIFCAVGLWVFEMRRVLK